MAPHTSLEAKHNHLKAYKYYGHRPPLPACQVYAWCQSHAWCQSLERVYRRTDLFTTQQVDTRKLESKP